MLGRGRMEGGQIFRGSVNSCAACGERSSNPVNLVNPVENALWVLHNPLARRRGGSFPMIGRIFGQDLQDGQDCVEFEYCRPQRGF